MDMLWILRDRKPVAETDVMTWAKWMEANWAVRRVALDVVSQAVHDPVTISTVFLGIAKPLERSPALFESMVFGGPLNGKSWRYCTWEQAEEGHKTFVEHVTVAGQIAASLLHERLNELSKGKQ